MVNVKRAAFCPACHLELVTTANACPDCGKILRPPESPYFELPYYLSLQIKDYTERLDEGLRDPDAKPLTIAQKKKFEAIKASFEPWVREIPVEERIGALRDAHLIMRNLVRMKTNSEELNEIMTLARSIGRIADGIDTFFKNGGTLDPETRDVPPINRGVDRSATSTARSGDSA